MQKAIQIVVAVIIALALVLFGLLMSARAYLALGSWGSISAAYAACGVLWALAGPGMVVGGLSMLASLGRRRIPLLIGGGAAVLAGGVLAVGVLTYVVPCAGPT